jgi:benzylsuccinate CoA-transferase BbsF subunit
VPRGVFPCFGEEAWCAIEVTGDAQWQRFVTALGAPAWMREPSLATLAGREARVDEIERNIARETRRFAVTDLVELLQAHGVAAAAVETSADVADDPQLRARGYWSHVPHREMGDVLVNKPPFRTAGEARGAVGPPPLLGEHSIEVATTLLCFSEAECRRLIDQKVFY